MRNEKLSKGDKSAFQGKKHRAGLTVSGYVTGRLNLIDNAFKMRDTPCPLAIA